MAKGNSDKGSQMLSPENYIRKKVRTLPVYECLVNNDWEESKMVQVVFARRHINGNITTCFYLVDLLCLGVKDTFFMFNVPFSVYKEKIEMICDGLDMEQTTYDLIHNIIYAGLEFADENGFSPNKDFTLVTSYML